jgi:hypothetical protein
MEQTQMKLNGKLFKVLLAFVIVIGTLYWAVDSVRSRSYSGTDLTFAVGSGTVKLTNPSEEPVPVQIVGAGSGSFRVSSSIEGVSGSSTRLGSGGSISQLFEFELPSGDSEFTVLRGRDVNFVASSATLLQATVNPASSSTTIIVAVIVIVGALFYASNATEHRWINTLRGSSTPAQPVVESASSRQGHVAQSYGDNRANTGD